MPGLPVPHITNTRYRDILKMAIPLIINMMSYSVMTFADRFFLGLYSAKHLAAANSPLSLAYTMSVIGYGVIWYISNLIGTYKGAKMYEKLAAPMWHGVYFSIFMAIIIIPLSFFAPQLFHFFQHDPGIIPYESAQLKILVWAIVFDFFANCCFGFLAGNGQTRSIMVANIVAMLVNVILDWWLIFGGLGVPALGIVGAGLGTMGGVIVGLIISICSVRQYAKKSAICLKPRWNLADMKTLLRFGLPSSLQLGMESLGFTLLSLIVGKLGIVSMLAYGILATMYGIFYMPLYGLSDGAAILAAHASGAKEMDKIGVLMKKSLFMGLSYGLILSPLLFFGEDVLAGLFLHENSSEYIAQVKESLRPLLRFLNIWLISTSIHTIIMQFLKTLGDTKFAMRIYMVLVPTMMVLPALILLKIFNNIQFMVLGILCFDLSMIIATTWRYKTGRWNKYRITI
ncbi:MAG: MATE family efflux transporter [Spirochaetia bacterium]